MRTFGMIALLAPLCLSASACMAITDDPESGENAAIPLNGEGHEGESSLSLALDARSDIDAYIRSLSYDTQQLLSTQEDGAISTAPPRERTNTGNAVIITTRTKRSLSQNLSEVVILSPTAGVVFPGATVIADQSLMAGKPAPITLPRGKMTISIDLPGLQNGHRVVENPTNSSVQNAISQMLEEWNRNPASQGYVNTARSYMLDTEGHSSQQTALGLGLNAKWASGSASAALDIKQGSQTNTVVAFFKQVFYAVTVDNPAKPSDFFADSVSLGDVQQAVNAQHPPAFVRSVDFGRILLVRMDTTSRDTKANLTGAFEQATVGVEASGTLAARYNEIVKNASFTVVAIGGGAQTAASFSGSVDDLKKLKEYIKTGAKYSRDNPGAPIAYTVAFMKDNALATLGLTTNYTETESVERPNGFIKLQHRGAYVGRFTVSWKEPDENGKYTVPRSWTSGNQTSGYSQTVNLPGDAQGVNLVGEAATGLVWAPWGEAINLTVNGPPNKCYRIKGTTLGRGWEEC